MSKTITDSDLIKNIKQALGAKKFIVKRPANGMLKHDYLVPGGYYSEQWDWDAFYMGVGFASEISSEAIFLRNWAMNYMEMADGEGYSPGCVTPAGPATGHRAFPMKPFIAQGSFLAGRFLNDFSWIKSYYSKLKLMVTYRERKLWNKEMDLGVWGGWVESGADNNPSILDFEGGTVVATDVNTFIYREFKAMSKIAKELGKTADSIHFSNRSASVKRNILKYLWDLKDQSFYNFNTKTGELIRYMTYSNLLPLWEKMAGDADGKAMIKKYVVNPKKLWAKHGVRTLAADDSKYNMSKIIHPYSNWQGPIWPHTNYMHMHGLLNYGFKDEALELARKVTRICLADIQKTGGMHECYHAETGVGLAGDNFVSWNLLVGNMLSEAQSGNNPFKI